MKQLTDKREIWQTNLQTAGKVYLFTLLSAGLSILLHMTLFMLAEYFLTVRYGDRLIQQLADGTMVRVDVVYQLDEQNNRVLDEKGREILWVRRYILDENNEWRLMSETRQDPPSETTTTSAALSAATTTGEPATSVVSSQRSAIRTDLSPKSRVLFDNVSQILTLLLFIAFPYSVLWDLGNKDKNKVQFNRQPEMKHRGLVIGLLANIPAFGAYLALWVIKALGGQFPAYRPLNFNFISIFNFIIPESIKNPADAPALSLLLWFPVLLILPLVTWIGYTLGCREISLKDKLVYTTTGRHIQFKKR